MHLLPPRLDYFVNKDTLEEQDSSRKGEEEEEI
jgi:hypothetical protein